MLYLIFLWKNYAENEADLMQWEWKKKFPGIFYL